MFCVLLEQLIDGKDLVIALSTIQVGDLYVCEGGETRIFDIFESMEAADNKISELESQLRAGKRISLGSNTNHLFFVWFHGPSQDRIYTATFMQGDLRHQSRKDEDIILIGICNTLEDANQLINTTNFNDAYATALRRKIAEAKADPILAWSEEGEA